MELGLSYAQDGQIAALWIGTTCIVWGQIRRLDFGYTPTAQVILIYVDGTTETFPVPYEQIRGIQRSLNMPGMGRY